MVLPQITHPLIIICGPTAVGKSSLAVTLAKTLNAEIIGADSQQIYREFDIGTGKISEAERDGVAHHLIDVAAPTDTCDVGQYVKAADQAIADITSRGHRVIVVGGTGMYLRALVYGLVKTASRDTQIRDQLTARMESEGLASLYNELMEVDPVKAAQLHPNDTTRIIRALEVWQATGQPLSEIQKTHGFTTPRYPTVWIGLELPRDELVARIHSRVDTMLANGWIDEVRSLIQKYGRNCAPFFAVGYREIADYLEGQFDEATLKEKIYVATRQYSKRQMTWFRGSPEIAWFSPTDVAKICDHIQQKG
ncbi:MAG: tRNA (adenosine(37)-N6)-dimethylallyltransferase MiaA [Deltaproteobacteria bacterium CG11_big_fil_rev_8_21_14_0_20_47_16]|nr:MAG: tRNA (adenosine(37)-N6)-dimethylallyltransferase MiaA [Deltaproteobacteria bacterium CG11_big_fil_rev_8_21_14_0_20_47_16]